MKPRTQAQQELFDVKARKKAIMKAKREREKPGGETRRQERRMAFRCFWTWPFRHIFEEWSGGEPSIAFCSCCGKETGKWADY